MFYMSEDYESRNYVLELYYDAACNLAYCFICLKAMNQVAMC